MRSTSRIKPTIISLKDENYPTCFYIRLVDNSPTLLNQIEIAIQQPNGWRTIHRLEVMGSVIDAWVYGTRETRLMVKMNGVILQTQWLRPKIQSELTIFIKKLLSSHHLAIPR